MSYMFKASNFEKIILPCMRGAVSLCAEVCWHSTVYSQDLKHVNINSKRSLFESIGSKGSS